MGQISRRLDDLGLALPPLLPKLANYVPTRTAGDLVFVSGHGPLNPDGSVKYRGRLGADLTVDIGQEAARLVMLNILASVQDAVGDLDRVREIVKLLVLVQSTAEFQEQHVVAEGASDLLVDVFGPDRGAHARSAVGMISLPFGIAVEIEAVIRVAD